MTSHVHSAGEESVFVLLPDELVEVYRPVRARRLRQGVFELDRPPDYDPDIERWEFPPGSVVLCETRRLEGKTVLVAVRLADRS